MGLFSNVLDGFELQKFCRDQFSICLNFCGLVLYSNLYAQSNRFSQNVLRNGSDNVDNLNEVGKRLPVLLVRIRYVRELLWQLLLG